VRRTGGVKLVRQGLQVSYVTAW